MKLNTSTLFEAPLAKAVREVSRVFTEANFICYVVGGFVRDVVLGNRDNAHDIDFATNALPYEVEALFARTIPTGKHYGTITVLMHGFSFEVTTFRKDGAYRDGRRPETVSFSMDFADDVKRRDFTVNALGLNIENGTVVDLCNGLQDLKKQKLRCIGSARDRFQEDALRMLRACRFVAQLGFTASHAIEEAIKQLGANIGYVSAERVRDELEKILLAKKPSLAFEMMQRTGLLHFVLPELAKTVGVSQNRHHLHDVFAHTLAVMDTVVAVCSAKNISIFSPLLETTKETQEKKILPQKKISLQSVVLQNIALNKNKDSNGEIGDGKNGEKNLNKEEATNSKQGNYFKTKDRTGKAKTEHEKASFEKIASGKTTKRQWAKQELIMVRWAALFHDLGKVKSKRFDEKKQDYTFYRHEFLSESIALAVMQRLKFSNKNRHNIALLVRCHMLHYEESWSDGAVRRFIARVGVEHLLHLFVLVQADRMARIRGFARKTKESGDEKASEANDELKEETSDLLRLAKRIENQLLASSALQVKDLHLNGRDLMAHFDLKPGKTIGSLLKALLEMVLDNPALNTKEKLLVEAKKILFKKTNHPIK